MKERYIDMTDNPVTEQPPNGPTSLQVLGAHIDEVWVSLGHPSDDLIDIITYSNGTFTRRAGAGRPGIPTPQFVIALQPEELTTLLPTLHHQLHNPQPDRNLDLLALEAFVRVLTEKAAEARAEKTTNNPSATPTAISGAPSIHHSQLDNTTNALPEIRETPT